MTLSQQETTVFTDVLEKLSTLLYDNEHIYNQPAECQLDEEAESPSLDCRYKGEKHAETGKRHGFGVSECLLTGNCFVGTFAQDSPSYGVMVYRDGGCYIGSFCEGSKHGSGICMSAEGSLYLG